MRGQLCGSIAGLDRGATTLRSSFERRAANRGNDLFILRRFYRDDRVARIDRATEFVRGLDRHDVAQLTDAEEGGNARQQVLTERRRGCKHVRVIRSERYDLGRKQRG